MQYKIRFAPRSVPDNIQRTVINADSEAEARAIMSDVTILDVEPLDETQTKTVQRKSDFILH